MINTLQILRILQHDTFTSGAYIAEQLSISRACVSQALQRAEHYGVKLERRVGVGYRLYQTIDWLDAEKVNALLGDAASQFTINIVPTIDSTNKALREDVCADDGDVLAAEWQHAGRGRFGRPWQGLAGGSLLFSVKKVFLQGVVGLSGLSLAVGVAVIRALKHVGVQGAGLKWPNDLVCAAGKVGGVLIEVNGDALGPTEVVIGIGLNCALSQALLLSEPYADLKSLGFTGDRNLLLATLLINMAAVLAQFSQQGLTPFVAEWEAAHLWQNQEVNIIEGGRIQATGKALGITEKGELRLRGDKQEQVVVSGDVSLRAAK